MLTRTEPSTNSTWTFLYDGNDQLRRITKRVSGAVTDIDEYWYDMNGQRSNVVKRNDAGAITEMLWFHGPTQVFYMPGGTTTRAYAHVTMGTPVARIERTSDTATTTEYQFHGLANSTLATVSSTGTINARFNYGPFGDLIESSDGGGAGAGIAVHKRRFNGKQQDDLSGLVYCGARARRQGARQAPAWHALGQPVTSTAKKTNSLPAKWGLRLEDVLDPRTRYRLIP